MKKLFSVFTLCFLLFVSCSSEPNRAEGEFVKHRYVESLETNNDKVIDEIIYKTDDFKIHKVTINDTIVSYFAYEYHTGFVKLN